MRYCYAELFRSMLRRRVLYVLYVRVMDVIRALIIFIIIEIFSEEFEYPRTTELYCE